MYKNVKLEKGLYHITGKRFSDMLEHMDPSEAYKDTALAGLDAYERQLKRFDIHVCGPHCDRVEKFFSTTESAVLFPEFIRRAVYRGIEQSVLSEIVAVQTIEESSEYLGGIFSDGTAYSTTTEQGNELPTATFYETNSAMKLKKYGRVIHASYEAVRRQRLDAFGAYLRSVGVRLSNALLQEATTAMFDQAGSIIAAGSSTLSYTDLTNLYAAFGDFDMTTILAAPENVAQIMALEQMKEMASTQPRVITLPFGAQLQKCAGMESDIMIGFDRRFAVEMVTTGELVLETDKLIDSQLDLIALSIRAGFRGMIADAIHVLSL